jgi:chlorobactene glucosyltransferase
MGNPGATEGRSGVVPAAARERPRTSSRSYRGAGPPGKRLPPLAGRGGGPYLRSMTIELLAALPWILPLLILPIVLLGRGRLRERVPDPPDSPLVSIIVPARNEALDIGACLVLLMDSGYPNIEVLLVDDESVDGTCEIARALAVRSRRPLQVVEGETLPAGWFGKPWACWQGYGQAKGELLLFTDADTRHDADLLSRAVASLMAERADLISVLPRQLLAGFWEQLVTPQLWIALTILNPAGEGINRTRRIAGGRVNGQFMLFRREAYEAVGGHAAVAAEAAEEAALAERLLDQGRRVFVAPSQGLTASRTGRSLGDLISTWTKNLGNGSRVSSGAIGGVVQALLAVGLAAFWIAPPAVLVAAAFGRGVPGGFTWSLVATIFSLLFWVGVAIRHRIPLTQTFFYPLGSALAAWILLRAWGSRGAIVWKGRRYERPAAR